MAGYGAPIVNNGMSRPGAVAGSMGPIYQYGAANPYGPYAGLQRAGAGTGASGSAPSGSTAGNSTALSYLEGVVGGQNTPYNEQTRNSMFSQASGMNAAAEGAQNQQLQAAFAMGGANPNDPSAQNAMRQNMAQRQGANQEAMGSINRTANIANQGAQQSAANTLLARETALNAQNQAASQTALSYLYGGGGSQGSGPNNFNLPQQMNQQRMDQQLDNESYMRQGRLERQQDAAWNNRASQGSSSRPSGVMAGEWDFQRNRNKGGY